MDTSKEYIKLCEKAEEIQSLCPLRTITPRSNESLVFSGDYLFWDGLHSFIWLPRQDQLQEMIVSLSSWEDISKITRTLFEFADFAYKSLSKMSYNGIEIYPFHHFTSMEQLWLAFVMHEKYNKVWDGEEWK